MTIVETPVTKATQEDRIAAVIQMPCQVNSTSRRRFEAACMWLLACEKKVTTNAVVLFLRKNGARGVSVEQVKKFVQLQSAAIESELKRIEIEDYADRKKRDAELQETYARMSF